jgi:hypothetical protein
MREARRLVVTLLLLACGYSMVAVLQLPNASSFDTDPDVGRSP